jgi:hypothetical protein
MAKLGKGKRIHNGKNWDSHGICASIQQYKGYKKRVWAALIKSRRPFFLMKMPGMVLEGYPKKGSI